MLKFFNLIDLMFSCLNRTIFKEKNNSREEDSSPKYLLTKRKKKLFFSHTWKEDELDRDNHKRVVSIAKKMNNYGWSTWIDEEDMTNNIDLSMAQGIINSEAVIIFLSREYIKKIENAVIYNNLQDNCYKEWNFSIIKNKLIIPIIMEPSLKNPYLWPGTIITMYLGNILYIDGSSEDINKICQNLHNRLLKEGKNPDDNKKIINKSISRDLFLKYKYSNLIENKNNISEEISFKL